MATTFTNISLEEMDAHLRPLGFSRIFPPMTKEAVFGKRCDRNGVQLTLRVFTGIVGNQSRECGKDAIRVCLFARSKIEGKEVLTMIGGTKRVHRVKNWRVNMQKRIDALLTTTPQMCNRCGLPMVERTGPYGTFHGCSGFPNCKFISRGES